MITSLPLKEPFVENITQEKPFNDQGEYQAPISVNILSSSKSAALFIQVIGKRISLETFQGDQLSEFKVAFGSRVQRYPSELEDVYSIFGDAEARKEYATGKPQSLDDCTKRINFNAKRAASGNPFTGFAVIENTTRKIVGFVSIGRGFENGEAQSGLILNTDYHHQGYGLETIVLAGALASAYAQQKYAVGSTLTKKPVHKFTVTLQDRLEKKVDFIKKIGFEWMRALTEKENSSDYPSSLYGVEAQDISSCLEKHIDLNLITYNIENV